MAAWSDFRLTVTACLKELLFALPPSLEFQPAAAEAGVTAGRVRPRREAAVAAYARAGYDGDVIGNHRP